MSNISKRMDSQRIIENQNIIISRRLYRLLRKDLARNQQWVAAMYKKLNMAMDNDDLAAIEVLDNESIAYEKNSRVKDETKTK